MVILGKKGGFGGDFGSFGKMCHVAESDLGGMGLGFEQNAIFAFAHILSSELPSK